MQQADVVIAGAGIVGLSLALELHRSGRSVLVLERREPGAGASRAAAGMLAAHDPNNPAELLELAERSISLYPKYLERLQKSGGAQVVFETEWILEQEPQHAPAASSGFDVKLLPSLSPDVGVFRLHRERSLDPRRLFASLLAAARQENIAILSGYGVTSVSDENNHVRLSLHDHTVIECTDFTDCTGAWSAAYAQPVKGQMLRLQMPERALYLAGKGNVVVRTSDVYLVPRLDGTCLVGATVEDAGFDMHVRAEAKTWLRTEAAAFLPGLETWPEVESWCGLRPAAANRLPVLGAVSEHCFVANGLYRNGILLAPAVAEVLCALVQGEPPKADLAAFRPQRKDTANILTEAHKAASVS